MVTRFVVSALLGAQLVAAPFATAAERQRSVVLIIIDSLRVDALQPYGSPRRTSPELLRFSKTATVFTHAYANAPWTRPSIMSLLTSRYPAELTTNFGGGTPLLDGQPTIATVLRSWGYRTGAFYNTAQLTPEAMNMHGGYDAYVEYGETKGADITKGFVARGVDRTIQFLKASNQPTFTLLHILDPHHPYLPQRNAFGTTPTMKFKDSFSLVKEREPFQPGKFVQCLLAKDLSIAGEMRELYDSEILEMDRELGRLLRFLETDKRYSDALVIITSDHGEEFGEHGGWYHGRMYEESLRVPLIIRDPARVASRGRRVNALVSLVDVLPTILRSVGIPFNARDYSGKDLVEYFSRRGGRPRTTIFFDKPICAYERVNAVRHGNWKMIIYRTQGNPEVELFDLATDPLEQRDISKSKDPKVQAAMKTILGVYQEWLRYAERPWPLRNEGKSTPLPAELLERFRALGYLY